VDTWLVALRPDGEHAPKTGHMTDSGQYKQARSKRAEIFPGSANLRGTCPI
jgi:hypothetical protein